MILDEYVKVPITGTTIKYFEDLGYEIPKRLNNWGKEAYCTDKTIQVKVLDLKPNSSQKIKVRCDICGKEKITTYRSYNKNIGNQNFYACSSRCAKLKIEKTCMDKYGCKNPSQSDEIKKKKEQTCFEHFGVNYYIQSDVGKESLKKTINEKYGVDNVFQLESTKEKTKNTLINKYGVDRTMDIPGVKEKIVQTNIEKYGVPYYTQTDEYKEKAKQTCLEKYGANSFLESERGRINSRLANLKDYTGYINEFNTEILYPLDENYTGRTPWKCRCGFCGSEFKTSPHSIITGNTISCGCIRRSLRESYIYNLLIEMNINFEPEYSVKINNHNYRYDFMVNINDKKLFIEYDGIMHYEDIMLFHEKRLSYQKERDQIKDSYCIENNIPLIRLPYYLSNEEIKDTIVSAIESLRGENK